MTGLSIQGEYLCLPSIDGERSMSKSGRTAGGILGVRQIHIFWRPNAQRFSTTFARLFWRSGFQTDGSTPGLGGTRSGVATSVFRGDFRAFLSAPVARLT